jgi:hypothetical protein
MLHVAAQKAWPAWEAHLAIAARLTGGVEAQMRTVEVAASQISEAVKAVPEPPV